MLNHFWTVCVVCDDGGPESGPIIHGWNEVILVDFHDDEMVFLDRKELEDYVREYAKNYVGECDGIGWVRESTEEEIEEYYRYQEECEYEEGIPFN